MNPPLNAWGKKPVLPVDKKPSKEVKPVDVKPVDAAKPVDAKPQEVKPTIEVKQEVKPQIESGPVKSWANIAKPMEKKLQFGSVNSEIKEDSNLKHPIASSIRQKQQFDDIQRTRSAPPVNTITPTQTVPQNNQSNSQGQSQPQQDTQSTKQPVPNQNQAPVQPQVVSANTKPQNGPNAQPNTQFTQPVFNPAANNFNPQQFYPQYQFPYQYPGQPPNFIPAYQPYPPYQMMNGPNGSPPQFVNRMNFIPAGLPNGMMTSLPNSSTTSNTSETPFNPKVDANGKPVIQQHPMMGPMTIPLPSSGTSSPSYTPKLQRDSITSTTSASSKKEEFKIVPRKSMAIKIVNPDTGKELDLDAIKSTVKDKLEKKDAKVEKVEKNNENKPEDANIEKLSQMKIDDSVKREKSPKRSKSREQSPKRESSAEQPREQSPKRETPVEQAREKSPKRENPVEQTREKSPKRDTPVEQTREKSPKRDQSVNKDQSSNPAASEKSDSNQSQNSTSKTSNDVKKPNVETEEESTPSETKTTPSAEEKLQPGFVKVDLDRCNRKDISHRVFDINFLMMLKDQLNFKPSDIPPMEAVIGEDASNDHYRGSHRRSVNNPDRGFGFNSDAPRSPGGRFSEGRNSIGGRYNNGPPGLRGPPGMNAPPGMKPPPGMFPSRNSGSRKSGSGRASRQNSYSNYNNSHHDEPAPTIVKGENRWVPKIEKPRDSADKDSEQALLDNYQREMRSMLNKVTMETLERLSAKMVNYAITSADQIPLLAAMIHEKAIVEHKFAGMYSQLCARLVHGFKNHQDQDFLKLYKEKNPEKISEEELMKQRPSRLFHRGILNLCQARFNTRAIWAVPVAAATDDMTPDEVAARDAQEVKRRNVKFEYIGNIYFIGELSKLAVLSENVLFGIFDSYLIHGNPEEEEVEAITGLMLRAGKQFDSREGNLSRVNQYFETFEQLAVNESISSRVRFKVRDLIDLRKNKWVERERQKLTHSGPMTIDQVRQQQKEEEAKKAERPAMRVLSRTSSGGYSSGNRSKSSAGDSWSTQNKRQDSGSRPTSRNNVTNNIPKRPTQEKTENPPSNTKANIFDLLNNDDHEQASPAVENLSESDESSEIELIDLPKNIVTGAELDKYLKKDFLNEFVSATDDSFGEAFKVFLKIRSMSENETEVTINALNIVFDSFPSHALKMDKSESSKQRVETLAEVVDNLFNFIEDDSLDNFLEDQLANLSEVLIDVPGLDILLAYIFAHLLANERVTLALFRSAILKYVDQFGDFSPFRLPLPGREIIAPVCAKFLFQTLDALSQTEMDILDVWCPYVQEELSSRKISYNDESLIYQVDAKMMKSPFWGTDMKKLESFIPNEQLISWAGKHYPKIFAIIAPSLFFDFQLSNLVLNSISDSESETVTSLIELLNGADEHIKSPIDKFVHKISSCILLNVFSKISDAEERKDVLKKLFGIIKDFEFSKEELIFSIQEIGNRPSLKSEQNFFYTIFDVLYDLGIIDEDSLLSWGDNNSRSMDTKEITMSRGARNYLEWLKTAETEA